VTPVAAPGAALREDGPVTDFDAVLFDAGGVLVVPNPAATGRMLAPFGGSTDEATLVRAHFRAAHAMDAARAVGVDADWPAYHRTYAAAAGVPADRRPAAVEAMSLEFTPLLWDHPVTGARTALAGLVGRGVPVGIVSNAEGQVEGELARLGICAVVVTGDDVPDPPPVPVACVVDSHVVGVSKPDPAIFEPALAALGLPASPRIAYVGDTVFYDVRAALAAGLTPLLHDPFGFHRGDPHPTGPHRTLRSLAELTALV
jgi:putative hydrolase of the HAD superfamily